MKAVLERTARLGVEPDENVNPLPGPRPFTPEERDVFFGRDRQISDILALLSMHRTVLVTAPSGTGKTSLLQAGVLPCAVEDGFDVLPIARVKDLGHRSTRPTERENVYIRNVVENWRSADPTFGPYDWSSLTDFLDRARKDETAPIRILVFDQFEELFVAHPERWPDRAGVFHQIQAALDDDPQLRILVLLRDDFLAQLEPFTGLLRDCLRTRYSLRGLTVDEAVEAVSRPLATVGRTFAPGAAEHLVQNLLAVPAESSTDAYQSQYVEPVQLQIVCRVFTERLPADVHEITKAHIDEYAEVSAALAAFYDRAVKAAVKTQKRLRERKVRLWCERELITPSHSRATVYRDWIATKGLPNPVVDELERQRIIRSEPRGNALWYELTHDRFINAVLDSNRAWFARRSGGWRSRLAIAVGVIGVLSAISGWVSGTRDRPSWSAEPTRASIEVLQLGVDIAAPGAPQTIVGKKGQLLTVFDYDDSPSQAKAKVELFDPDGNRMPVAHGTAPGPLLSAELPTDGEYSIRASSNGDPRAELKVLVAAQHMVETRRTIDEGGHEGTLDEPNAVDVYEFVGRKGALAAISMRSTFINADLVLRTPSNVVLENDDLSGTIDGSEESQDALLALPLPEDGTYEIRAFASRVEETGPYELHLGMDEERSLAIDTRPTPAAGRLDTGEIKAYTVRIAEGDALEMKLSSVVGAQPGDLYLLDSSGRALIGHNKRTTHDVRLAYPARPDRSYTVVIRGIRSGAFHLTLRSLVSRELGKANVQGDFSSRDERFHVYRIANRENTIGTILLATREVSPIVQIVGPSGGVASDVAQSGNEEIVAVPLTEGGEYYAFVGSALGEGSYSLSFVSVPTPQVR